MKRPPLLALALALLAPLAQLALFPPAPAEAGVTLRASQVLPADHPSQLALIRLGELLKEGSQGEMELSIVDSREFGGERELIEASQMGELDLIVTGTAALYGFTSDFLVFDLPYVFPDLRTAREVTDSPFGLNVLDKALVMGLKGLAYYENGMRNVSANIPARLPEDLKGLPFRTMESRIHLETFRALGANAVPLSFSELYDHLKKGLLEGEENPVSIFMTGKLYETQKYYSLTGHFYTTSPVFINLSVWNKLDQGQKDLILKCARESALYQRELLDEFDSPAAMDALREKVTVISDIDRGIWKRAVSGVREKFEAEVGEETLSLFDEALKTAANENPVK
ncbi:MAG: DctP family TRAP transporter solute-binding subunit [Deltaproteobacteria bacterium]|jgi:tripartite ATP-independent transporter DctP family solute receptor|nr:DctP family TRAP transporter solute-binding subunit [Deltaproteobacteria bacterium]